MGVIRCMSCRAPVNANQGILDFAAGLKAITDQRLLSETFAATRLGSPRQLYESIKALRRSSWPRTLGDTIEIGCGEGWFSRVILSEIPAQNVVLTDLSSRTLVVCRSRLGGTHGIQAKSLTFATFSGLESCLATDGFDTCYGVSTLSRSKDIPRFLSEISRIVKPAGAAIFIEPNPRYLYALAMVLAGSLVELLQTGVFTERQADYASNFLSELKQTLVDIEEKSIFSLRTGNRISVAEALRRVGHAVGFASVDSVYLGDNTSDWPWLSVNLRRHHLDEAGLTQLRKIWPTSRAELCPELDPRDRFPICLIWLSKDTMSSPRKAKVDVKRTNAAELPIFRPLAVIHAWLQLTLKRNGDGAALHVEGWCVARVAPRLLQVRLRNHDFFLPICRPRRDVQTGINSANIYPPFHSRCSGVEGDVLRG
jgi:ubiquinone/menaquinone biosynthesis C-methylase UbiE